MNRSSEDYKEIKDRIQQMVMELLDLSHNISDEEVWSIIDRLILENFEKDNLSILEKVSLRKDVFNSVRRLDVLTEFIEDPSITEIMVNGCDSIFIEKDGRIIETDVRFSSEQKLFSVIQQIVAGCNRRVNEASPIADARLSDGSRVNIVIHPISLGGSTITIRKFIRQIMDMKQLVQLEALQQGVADVLKLLVASGYNIFISGGTGSGKTTFLNALSEYIPSDERVITIEDAAELQINGVRNLVRMEARPANVEGNNGIDIRTLIKASLRMRPDRIIVGEVRDQAAIDMLAAMNTGHDGSISTGHANSCEDMVNRLCTMVLMGIDIPLLAIKQQISSAIDIFVHLGRLRDKSRRVLKICEMDGMENGEIKLRTLYEFVETGKKLVDGKERIVGELQQVVPLKNINKLCQAGLWEEYQRVSNNEAVYHIGNDEAMCDCIGG